MTAAIDTEGAVFVSQTGSIRLVAQSHINKGNGQNVGAYWVTEDKRVNLLEIPVDRNQGVIFNELGIYTGQYLGSPCDPLFGDSQPKVNLAQ